MSWIVQEFWQKLDSSIDYRSPKVTFRMFSDANQIAAEVGGEWGLTIQLNFPVGGRSPNTGKLGRSNLSLLVDPGRKKFRVISEGDVRKKLQQLDPSMRFEPVGYGYEGFTVLYQGGRIDCLPGGVHLWCEITDPVLQFLDWLFINAYGVSPAHNEKSE